MSNSDPYGWSEDLSSGITLIDNQHKEIMVVINDLLAHVSGDELKEKEYFVHVIQKTMHKIRIHFVTEEKILRLIKYSAYVDHKRAHDALIMNIVDSIREFEAGKKLSLSSFAEILKHWLVPHIEEKDKPYFRYIRQIATRKENGKLSITADDVFNSRKEP